MVLCKKGPSQYLYSFRYFTKSEPSSFPFNLSPCTWDPVFEITGWHTRCMFLFRVLFFLWQKMYGGFSRRHFNFIWKCKFRLEDVPDIIHLCGYRIRKYLFPNAFHLVIRKIIDFFDLTSHLIRSNVLHYLKCLSATSFFALKCW